MAHKVQIRQQFDSFLAFGSFKECYQNTEYVQFYRRDSRTVEASAPRCYQVLRSNLAITVFAAERNISQLGPERRKQGKKAYVHTCYISRSRRISTNFRYLSQWSPDMLCLPICQKVCFYALNVRKKLSR